MPLNDGLTRAQRYRLKHPERAAQSAKRYRENHPERSWAQQKAWRARNPRVWTDIKRRSQLDGLLGEGAFEHFEEQRKLQAGVCAICHQPMQKACSDHNHETGTWRGLLCDNCNRGLGLLKDSLEVLESAITYLKLWR